MKIGCIVLAAGHSRRFGGVDKLAANLGGKPLLRWTLDLLPQEVFSDVCAVAASDAVRKICDDAGFPCAMYPGGELSDSIRTGLGYLPEDLDGYMFINGDRPLLKAETIRRLASAFADAEGGIVRLSKGGVPSNPAIFPGCARNVLMQLAGDTGGSALIRSGAYRVIAVEAEEDIETWDADSPAALDRLRAIIE